LTGDYDAIVVGCVNSPIQILAMGWMRLLHIPYILNLDGEIHMGAGLKKHLKLAILKGASTYLVAGKTAAGSLQRILPEAEIVPYNFSSLTEAELASRETAVYGGERSDTVLVVGQYFDYKGMDVALEAARMDPSISYKFVGMSGRTELFRRECGVDALSNVEVIPFLQKEELNREYQICSMMVLPSRKECWGLVVNEAASFGTPVVSTWGSGAAVEFLSEECPQYLAEPGDAASLLEAIRRMQSCGEQEAYGRYLQKKNRDYCIETICRTHLKVVGITEEKE
jgi:glycosyltransferase involved in cell wall biosynthesis